MKKLLAVIFSLSLVFTFAQNSSANDIDEHWAEPYFTYLIQNNIVTPENGNYYPDRSVTRAEFASFIARSLKLTETSSKKFIDVPASYQYADDISKAAAAGIISGYTDGSFKPNNKISRQHMAVMLNSALKHMEMPSKSGTLKYADTSKILKDYVNAVNTATAYGIFNGSPVNGKYYFNPNNNASRANAAVVVSQLVKQVATVKPGSGLHIPEINTDKYELKKIVGGQAETIKTADTYEEVISGFSLSNGHFISLNDKNVKISYGLATTNQLTNIYSSNKVTAITYVEAGAELLYKNVDSSLKWVEIEVAGKTGYVRLSDVTLSPYGLLAGRNSYKVESGLLKHNLFNHVTKKSASYIAGPAPSFLKEGQTYYSFDGITFINSSSQTVGKAYNYYQFLPVHAKTSYTAAEIDNYIFAKLTEYENKAKQNQPGYTVYKDATKKSKLIGIGSLLKKMEETYNVNAMMVLSLAINESTYGMSDRAQLENNLFGLYVYDTNPLLKKFESVELNINELATKFWKANYIPPNAKYASGAVLGNKNIGFNVRYASDPYWGAKAAGHYYQMDKAMGSKDAKANYQIGLSNTTGLNVRSGAGTFNPKLFTYVSSNIPVLIVGQENGWYNIVNDATGLPTAYVSGDYIDILPTYK
ncbi:S-layer homology domain-containing protein [Ureibacillus chungkukjangi]|uniref:S-layer homology domain-containing protein n=1 Tax=Ureibacillus chungkukjangi TaxID=1202712 RepID=UPI00203D03EB|nr:S-layer homology domain-containing protein [Ureibacillus chungkukjangi]MCM3389122.1 S-layer homology domain-containing protein [Ureibacillus chungkukjangi]